jgi:hypothetical protein
LAGFFSFLFFSSFPFASSARVPTMRVVALFRRTYYVGAFLSVLPKQRVPSSAVGLGVSESWRYGAKMNAIACFFRGFSTS